MKKILLILFCIPLIGFGQENTEFIQIQQEINIMKENLNSHHKQNKAGYILVWTGTSSAIIGSLIISPPLAIGGAVISFIGGIIMFNSHKWFGKKKMKGHFIIGKRNKKHYLKKIYHKGNIWKIDEEVECYVNGNFEIGKITNIILLSNDDVDFEVKLENGSTVIIDWTNLEY